MAIANPNRVLNKFAKLHRKLKGYDRDLQFVKFTNAVTDLFSAPAELSEFYTPTIPVIVKDQPDKDMQQSFPGGIANDQKLFIFVADSLVARVPLATLSFRAENFLLERTGQSKGGIVYGNTTYAIERIVAKPILGSIAARYILLASAQKQDQG